MGTSGSGKTYVAEALSRRRGLRYVCNDALIWRADWEPVPREERLPAFDEATRQPGWVSDGNLGDGPEDQLLLQRCDTIVWLDLPRWQVHPQIALRTLRRAWTKEPMWHGNVERWRTLFSRDSMIWWSVKTFARRRRNYERLFSDPAYADRTRIRLRSRGEVNAWLESVS
jgi:adenylate kinase family enzyme